jgi:hypothetical protein
MSSKPLTTLCENGKIVDVIKWVSIGHPVDIRDIINALEKCIETNMNAKFIYLFNRFVKSKSKSSLYIKRFELNTKMLNYAILNNNSLIIRYLSTQ